MKPCPIKKAFDYTYLYTAARSLAVVWRRAICSQPDKKRPLPRPDTSGDMTKGLQIRLSEGAESGARPQPLPLTAAAPLSDQAAQNVLNRLGPIKAGADDEKDFQIRDRSLPAPRTGKTIDASFPPSDTSRPPDTRQTGPLEVLRYSPEGDVPLAPQLSVTFSHPMVAVTSHADASPQDRPFGSRRSPMAVGDGSDEDVVV